jgi:hypothetical protein
MALIVRTLTAPETNALKRLARPCTAAQRWVQRTQLVWASPRGDGPSHCPPGWPLGLPGLDFEPPV